MTALFRAALIGVALLAFQGVTTAQPQSNQPRQRNWRKRRHQRIEAGTQQAHSQPRSHTSSGESRSELTRAVRPWEFLPAMGTRAGLLGNECGPDGSMGLSVEDFARFSFEVSRGWQNASGGIAGADADYAAGIEHDRLRRRYIFGARDIFCAGARGGSSDFAGRGDGDVRWRLKRLFTGIFSWNGLQHWARTYESWDSKLHAFALGEEQRKFEAIVGSPTAEDAQ